jgi:ABC-type multidrug transport system ATPase subunit
MGVELITEPQILLLDEVTSGLDSFNAFKMVCLLHRLARSKNMVILASIHQPSSASFAKFD